MERPYNGQPMYYAPPHSNYHPQNTYPAYQVGSSQGNSYGQQWPSMAPSGVHTPQAMPRPKKMRRFSASQAEASSLSALDETERNYRNHLPGSHRSHRHPLKPALKRGFSIAPEAVPIARVRTTSDTRSRPPSRPSSRQGVQGASGPFLYSFIIVACNNRLLPCSEYLFLSFHGNNEFRLENVHFPDTINCEHSYFPMN